MRFSLKILIFCWCVCLFTVAQTSVLLAPVPRLQFLDESGRPLAFGCVFTYQSGTTTPLATYTDSTGVTLNKNPVILSAGGSANIWLQAGVAYSFKIKGAGGVQCFSGPTEYTVNGIGGGVSVLTTNVTYSSTPTFTVLAQLQLFEITLTGDASSQPLSVVGLAPPVHITWQITQDSSGNHAFTWPANTVGGCTIGATANQVTTQHFVWNGFNATAIGPCTVGDGPEIDTGAINATGNITTTGIFTGDGLYTTCANPALSGFLRMCKTERIEWRNTGNTADYGLGLDTSDRGLWSFSGGLDMTGANPNIFFGGTTSSFPMLKRNAAALNVRLADDSGDADLSGGNLVGNTSVTAGVVKIHGVAAANQSLIATSATDAQWSGSFLGGTTQFVAVSPGCTANGSPCTAAGTWGAAFSDNSYFVVCTATSEASNSIGGFWISAKTNSGFTITIDNRGTSNPGGFDSFDCMGHHN